MSEDINVLALAKGDERYLFLFNEETRSETLRTLGKYASNAELSFTWYDAAVLSQKIRAIRNNEDQAVAAPAAGNPVRFQLPPLEDLFSDNGPDCLTD